MNKFIFPAITLMTIGLCNNDNLLFWFGAGILIIIAIIWILVD